MKNYTCGTCHEMGYGWQIQAPNELNPKDIKAIVDSLIEYTDTFSNNQLQMMLDDEDWCEAYLLEKDKMHLFKQITLSVERVHSNGYSQFYV